MKQGLAWYATCCCLGLWAVPAAQATRAADMPPPTAEAVRRAASAAAVSPSASPVVHASADAERLRDGVISAVDREHGRVQIEGKWFRIVEGQTLLYRLGRAAEPGVLDKGQQVRFTLPSGAADDAVLGLVYVR